jgi:hypothetical protein
MTVARFRYVFVTYIVYASLKTLLGASQLAAQHAGLAPWHLYLLAGAEILAALGLLLRRGAAVAGYCLLGVFALAALIDVALGEVPAHLLLYAAITSMLLRGEAAAGAAPAVR